MTGRPILVVDDDEDTCATLTDILSDLGYAADAASGPAEALGLAGRRPYRLALLDYRMPGMTGVELFGRLRAYGIEGVLITGHANPDVAAEAAAAGMRALLPKPLDPERLLRLVEQAAGPPA